MSRIRLEVDPQLSEDGEPIVSVRTVDGRQASLCVDPPLALIVPTLRVGMQPGMIK